MSLADDPGPQRTVTNLVTNRARGQPARSTNMAPDLRRYRADGGTRTPNPLFTREVRSVLQRPYRAFRAHEIPLGAI